MKGDKLVVKPEHVEATHEILKAISPDIRASEKYTISVGGESGSGKSEIAQELKTQLEDQGVPAGILQMDDYFIFPSRTCHEMRTRNLEQVGLYEARLDFMECNLRSFRRGDADIYKPLHLYGENRFVTEEMPVGHLRVLIADGTYTTALRFIDTHVFLDRNYRDTRADREERARDILDDVMLQILEREHKIVREQKKQAEIVVAKDFGGIEVRP